MRAAVLVVSSLLLAVCAVRASELVQPLTPAALAALYPNGIPERPAMFGIPQYTASITGLVVYATPGDRDACKPLERTDEWPPEGSTSLILMVDRGNCTFVTKVRNVEVAGGSAAIIVDNVDESNLPYMADDGTGASIRIPSVLIHKSDGQNIKDALNTTLHPSGNTTVLMKMTWNLPHPDNHVEWEFWTSSWDNSSVSFKNVFGTAVAALGDAASMTPHYSILGGGPLGCTTSAQSCGNQCTNHGRYCNVDPDHNTATGLSGANLVEEDLRQICLARVLNTTGQDNLWWDYVRRFNVECSTVASWNAICSTNIITSLGINAQLVTDCVAASNGTVDNKPNKLLDTELALKSAEGIFFVPTLVINGAQYRGSLYCPEPLDIATCGPLEAICAGYADGTQPAACLSSPGCGLGVKRDPCGLCGGDGAMDSCGLCMSVSSPLWNTTCLGCDGIPWSGTATDACGVCGGSGSFDACSRCLPANSPDRVDQGGIDVCGHCLAYSNPLYNNSGCIGCNGKPFSGLEYDACGTCGGDGSFDACGRCFPANDPKRVDSGECSSASSSDFPVAATVGIVIASVVVVGGGVFFYMKRQQTRMRDDIDSLLRQYLPLEAANDMAHTSGRTQDQHRLVSGADSSVNRTDSTQ